ncbi:hypothetical protein FB451DRAFT_1145259 [Mycena latifolia]|nr:hypothetical protein FB451DRAFT_1145259 [Mycena latifolia]
MDPRPPLPTRGDPRRRGLFHQPVLSALCLVLHIGLVLVHVALAVIGTKQLERNIVFGIEHQSTISFGVTALTTGIAIPYLASALFVAQKLAMHYNLHATQTLTATHDNVSSWNGLGSALSTLYRQISAPASVLGTLAITGYLGCISMLHITTPAIFSVSGFNASVVHTVQTLGVLEFNSSASWESKGLFVDIAVMFLPWIGEFDSSQTLGLFNGTLYNTLQDLGPGRGEPTISATGFNISCGYLPGVNVETKSGIWNIALGSAGDFQVTAQVWSSGPNIITTVFDESFNDSIVLYTPNTVVDSAGAQGFPVELTPGMGPNVSVTHLQFLRCSKTLVNQEATVDGQSGQLIERSLSPSIYKTRSTWQPSSNSTIPPPDSTFVGGYFWTDILAITGDSSVPLNDDPASGQDLSFGDLYLMDRLGLDPSWIFTHEVPTSVPVLNLHDIENSLSSLVASLFWMVGRVQPDPLEMQYSNGPHIAEGLQPPFLTAADTVVSEDVLRARLEISLLAVWSGLGVSLVLCILAVPYAFLRTGPQNSVTNTGLLHTIWLFRNNPHLRISLLQVADPLDTNLRSAGLIEVQLTQVAEKYPSTPRSITSAKGLDASARDQKIGSRGVNSHHIICIGLHVFLVVLHLALLAIALSSHAEHAAIFPFNAQKTVSLWITVSSTAFGTIYLAAIVYITQRIAVQYYLGQTRTLTATHDAILSWSGIGSALSSLYNQLGLPASITGVLSVAGYLATISFLHLTTPALLSVQTFNHTILSDTVQTHGIPQWNASDPGCVQPGCPRGLSTIDLIPIYLVQQHYSLTILRIFYRGSATSMRQKP